MRFVEAYDRHTGEKLPHLVPERFIGHPVIGPHLAKTPRQEAEEQTPAATVAGPAKAHRRAAKTPPVGDAERN